MLSQVQEAKEYVTGYRGPDDFLAKMARQAEREGWVPTPAEARKIIIMLTGGGSDQIAGKPTDLSISATKRDEAESFLRGYVGNHPFIRSVKRQLSHRPISDAQCQAVLKARAYLPLRLDKLG